MKLVIQRVNYGSVTVEGNVISEIGKGFVVLFGAGEGDTEEMADKFAEKMIKLRIFEDENGKTNRSLTDVNGELLIISQFTLYADCRKKGIVPVSFMPVNRRGRNIYMNIFLKNVRNYMEKYKEGVLGRI